MVTVGVPVPPIFAKVSLVSAFAPTKVKVLGPLKTTGCDAIVPPDTWVSVALFNEIPPAGRAPVAPTERAAALTTVPPV